MISARYASQGNATSHPSGVPMGLASPKCPNCGSTFVVRPSPWDMRQLWRCEHCGAAWKSPFEPEPVARRHMANPLFPWPPKEML